MDIGDFRQQEEAAAKAVGIAEAVRDRRLIRRAELYRYGALWFMGRHEGVYTALQEYVRILEEDGDLVPLFQLTVPLSVMALWRGELQASREYGERALDLARRIGDPIAIPSALSTLASSLFLLGDWKGARARLERAITMARPIDTANYLPAMLSTLGHLTVCEGDWDAGEALLRDALKLIEEGDTRGSNHLPHQFLANLDLLRGHPQ
jgi:tetratricopeptide (TPR) repeat protein